MAESFIDGDIKFYYTDRPDNLLKHADIRLDRAKVYRDPGFETAVLIALFSDQRATEDDIKLNSEDTKRGWWADAYRDNPIGSKLWTLGRSRINDETITLAEQYAKDALAPMIIRREIDDVQAVVTRGARANELNFTVVLIRKDKTGIFTRFFINWEKQIIGEAA